MKRFAVAILIAFLFFAGVDRQAVRADCRSFTPTLHNGALAVAAADGRLLAACAPDRLFIPASILKIATALIALQILGPEYRFQTELFLDQEQNLYVKGYGDPFLVAEEVALLMEELRERGTTRINSIFIDNSSYDLSAQVPGRGGSNNPYDVPVNATAVNFNAVAIRVGKDRQVRSAEAQTPTVPLMREMARGLSPGEYRLNICPGQSREEERSARYVAELLRALQRAKNIPGDGQAGLRPVPAGARLVLTHRNTRTLAEVLVAVLEHSNNFAANQMFLASGAARFGYPATWDKARRAGAEVLAQLLGPASADSVRMVEGSGLSRDNRITARAMLELLRVFAPHASLLREQDGVRLKSGSMTGVHNYAGYLPNGSPFAILENQPANTRDQLLKRLVAGYQGEQP